MPTRINFDKGTTVVTFDVRIVHGIFMSMSWFILSLGVLFSRYLRGVGAADLWFQAHRATQIVGTIGSFIGFCIIIVYVISTGGSGMSMHPMLGIIIHIVLLLHFIWALFRPHIEKSAPKSYLRKLWEIIHHYTGRILVLLAFFTIPLGLCKFVGTEINQLSTCFANTTVQPYLIFHFIVVFIYLTIVIVKEIINCRNKKPYVQIQ